MSRYNGFNIVIDIKQKHKTIRQGIFNELQILLQNNSWSNETIITAFKNINIDLGYQFILFPNGLSEVVISFENYLDNKMNEQLKLLPQTLKIREKIARALELRIIDLSHQNIVKNTAAFFLLPLNIPNGLKSAWNTSDLIWKFAGDNSVDYNYYSKRVLLCGAYAASSTFYLSDNSDNYINTREFIKNALDNIINIASLKNKITLPKKEDIPILRLFS